MLRRICLIVFITSVLVNCKQDEKLTAKTIIDSTIEVSGGNKVSNSTIEFNFRDIHYTAHRNNGIFELGRTFVKENDTIVDWLTNIGFQRTVNRELIKVADSMVSRYSASVNSVHYFSVLPYGLNDAAVNKNYISEVKIKGETYHKIRITFNEDGGGEDFDDVFLYYVNKENFKVDYLAYSYAEDHGIGLRFREAYNERIIKGIRFVDYNNYKFEGEAKLEDLETLFEANKLKLLSKIELKEVAVN
ncbi:deoxyribose-phosphate aldolase [Seonamhaeicola algicola]|uniref:Deoxyribose-phosphate aldolase n=1 Tax=Seonamhaeicola algicola TaxID=1719036 RepID=A0A5C7B3K4_9FLAO|nr:DUF6503 family protein [Seonamhaeicola algicola]TXE15027.1 deoxyribose-phosphate aldolase [Seonamhaeicola algicola]